MANPQSPEARHVGGTLVFSSAVIFCMVAAFIAVFNPGILQMDVCTQLSALLLCVLVASMPLQFLPRRGHPSDASQIAAIGIKGVGFSGLVILSIVSFILSLFKYTQWAWCMIILCIGGTCLMLLFSRIASIFVDNANKIN